MGSVRGRGICRSFINGSCSLGSSCSFRHERQVLPASQICRYFQKGRCWYGERCRYLHVLQPDVVAAAAGRRSSVPTVSSAVTCAPPDRRGSEPAVLHTDVISTQEGTRPQFLASVSHPPHAAGCLAADIAEEQPEGADAALPVPPDSEQSLQVAQEDGDERKDKETSSSGTAEGDGAAAAASSAQQMEEGVAFLQSKNVTCGICMDKVYEKRSPRNRVFGILPNCSHSFCLQCIMTWRKTKDLGPDVVKACPLCRVRSAFYVPNKYWVEGQVKENVISTFKMKFRKKICIYYAQFGCCPFKAECLYRHDKRSLPGTFLARSEDEYDGETLLNFIIAMTFLAGDEDDEDLTFYLSEDGGF
ncbi:makorin, ring finger protein, 4 [Brachionichthys hirsutus]|uniref:makorin, ring finger protein, 4 n=1 Tax=Brachionichthys hirsutus TaxID=412623 RepID=UPI003604DF4B